MMDSFVFCSEQKGAIDLRSQALEQQHLEEQFSQHHYFDPASRQTSRKFSAHFYPQTNFTTAAMPDLNQAVRFV